MKKIRQQFADLMLEVGTRDKKLVVLVGDISHGILQPFAKKCPTRYYNIGICEPSIVNMAAGLSKSGLNPVVHTIAPFITERACEQIKLDFGYQKQNINLITVGGSFDYSKLGCSHHCYTDVSLFTHFKNSSIVIPGTNEEFKILFKKIYKQKNIKYFRIPEYSHNVNFKRSEIIFGKAIRVAQGKDLTIVVTGTQLKNAIESRKQLLQKGYSIEILYYHTLKPFDYKKVENSLKKTKKLLSIEELSAHGGLYDQCIKSVVGVGGIKTEQLAVFDFIHGYGSYEDICKRAGLSVSNITKKALKLLD